MSLDNKRLSVLTEQDFQELITDQVAEGKYYEYKQALTGGTDAEKKEFLADVSSFANTVGGHIIYGMAEAEGVPTAIMPLKNVNSDEVKQRMENLIRDGIEPRIAGIDIEPIHVDDGIIVVIRIPRSWAQPHMVTFSGSSKFYARYSAGKFPLDVNQIGAAFLAANTTTETARNFRLDRVSKVISEDTPIPLVDGPKILLHIVPLNAFGAGIDFKVSALLNFRDQNTLSMLHNIGFTHAQHNFDGALFYRRANSAEPGRAYTQFFRNGIVESVITGFISESRRKNPAIYSGYEKQILTLMRNLLTVQEKIGAEPPMFIMISVLNVKNYVMLVPDGYLNSDEYPIDRDHLLMAEIMLDGFQVDLATALKPVFYSVWNAAGWPQSINYDDSGKWIAPT